MPTSYPFGYVPTDQPSQLPAGSIVCDSVADTVQGAALVQVNPNPAPMQWWNGSAWVNGQNG